MLQIQCNFDHSLECTWLDNPNYEKLNGPVGRGAEPGSGEPSRELTSIAWTCSIEDFRTGCQKQQHKPACNDLKVHALAFEENNALCSI